MGKIPQIEMKNAARKKSARGRRIGLPEIEQMFTSYLEDPRPNTIARKLGIDERTVRRYIEEGDPKLGIKSFRSRHSKMLKKQDFDRAKEQEQDLRLVGSLISQTYKDLFEFDKDGKAIGLRNDPNLHDFDKLIRLKHFLGGAPDSRTEIQMTADTQVVVQKLIEVVQEFVKDQETRNKIADGLFAAFHSADDSRGAQGSDYAQ